MNPQNVFEKKLQSLKSLYAVTVKARIVF